MVLTITNIFTNTREWFFFLPNSFFHISLLRRTAVSRWTAIVWDERRGCLDKRRLYPWLRNTLCWTGGIVSCPKPSSDHTLDKKQTIRSQQANQLHQANHRPSAEFGLIKDREADTGAEPRPMGGGETDKGGSMADVAFIQPDRNHLEYIYFYIYTHTNSRGGGYSIL